MSDWSMYELEDIVWDEFGESDDHIVPRRAGEQVNESVGQGDSYRKPRHEVVTAVGRTNNEPMTKNAFQETEVTSFHSLKDGKSPLLESPWSHASNYEYPVSCDPQCINEVTALTSQDSRTSNKCFNGHKVDIGSNNFCSDDPILGNAGIADDSEVCQSSLVDISPEDANLDFLENDNQDRENGYVLDYEWPDIGNFEDVDRMLRTCDSTFWKGSIGSADELSWFSSSHAIDGFEETYKSVFQSSCSELCELKSSTKLHGGNVSFLLENDPPTTGCNNPPSLGYRPYVNWLDEDVENKEEFSSKKKINEGIGGDEIKIAALTQNSSESSMSGCQGSDMDGSQRNLPKSQYQSGGRKKVRPSEFTNGHSVHVPLAIQQFERKRSLSSAVSVPQTNPPQLVGHRNQFWGADHLSYPQAYSSYVKMEYGHPLEQIPVEHSTSCVNSENKANLSLSYEVSLSSSNHCNQSVESSLDPPSNSPTMTSEEKIEKQCHKRQVHSPLTIKHQSEKFVCQAAFTSQGSVQNKFYTSQNEVRGDNELEETSIEVPEFEINSSTVQETSGMTSVLSDDMSLGLTSFQKLQNVVDQLDIRTKLCIRDGLYRLARSAEQRHSFDSTNHGSGASRDASRIPGIEESKKSAGLIDVETGTNPVDRFIAQLLFHKASASSTSPVDDAIE